MDTNYKTKRRGAETAKRRRDFFICISPRSLRLCVLPPSVFIRVHLWLISDLFDEAIADAAHGVQML